MPVWASETIYDSDPVNGHAGYLSAWRVSGDLDKPIIIVKGYDNSNDDHPIDDFDDDLGVLTQALTESGFDIIIFDYVNGTADLKQNADNLASFIHDLDGIFEENGVVDLDNDGHPDYELSVIGGSMGGIVARTMFVQENDAMGVDTFVSLDAPHHGVYLSPYISWVTDFLDTIAGHQMLEGDDAYFEHYNWLRAVESNPEFKARVIDPMHTAAIALSDGESSWHLDLGDLIFHTDYHDVSSYVEKEEARSDYIPYHSAVNMDNPSTMIVDRDFDSKDLKYTNTHTSYFDQKIQNPRAPHGGPDYAILQAIDFVVAHSSQPSLQIEVIKRAEISKSVLQAIYGYEYIPPTASGIIYSDVQPGDFNADWIEKLALDGITEGCSATQFCPDMVVTKEQLSKILLKALFNNIPGYKPPVASGSVFNDISINRFAAEWIEELFNQGITEGCDANKFCPKQAVTLEGFTHMLNKTFP
jgi:pimeloyl-ACP methyl ester carboxylesterase